MSEAMKEPGGTSSRRFKPYPAYKDSDVEWLGEIPAHWDAVSVKRLGRIRYGLGQPPAEALDGLPLLRATNISSGRILEAGMIIVDPADVPKGRDAILSSGEIIVVRSGAYTGDSAIVPVEYAGAVIGYDMVVSVHRGLAAFHAWQLLAPYVRDLQFGFFSLRAAQPHLNAEQLGSTIVLEPPTEAQRAIVSFLDRETARIDALVAKEERLIELLQEKRTALITRAVTKGLDPNVPMKDSGVEWLGEIPAHWEVKRVKNLSGFVTSGSRGWAEHYADDGPVFLRIGNLSSGTLDLDLTAVQHVQPPPGTEGQRTCVQGGDVLVSITALIGAVGVVPDGFPEAFVNQHLALVRPTPGQVDSRWLGYCALSRVGQQQMSADLYGGTKDGLGLDDIRSLLMLLPPLVEQKKIVDILDLETRKTEDLVIKIRAGIDLLKEYRTALISAAVTGKIDVRSFVTPAKAGVQV